MAKNATSFKPGIVTNPNGRPKRDWTVAGLIEAAMEESDKTGVPYKKIVYTKLVEMARKGDIMAIREISNRLDGLPEQKIKHSGEIKGNTIQYIESRHDPEGQ